MASTLKMGIVGCGNSARSIHYPKLKNLRDRFEVAACCDLDAERAAEVGTLYDAQPYTDYQAFLRYKGLDLVLVATKPPSTHALLGLQALEAGKHVVLEKPMCATHAEGVALIDAARKAGRLLTVYHSRRWDPEFIELRWAIAQGLFGDIRLFESMMGTNLLHVEWLIDWGVHLIDQCLVVCGGRPVEVSCVVTFPDKAETGGGPWTAWIRFDNGKLAVASQKIGELGTYPRFSVVGDQGGCAWPNPGTRRVEGTLSFDETQVVTVLPAVYRGRESAPLQKGEVRIPVRAFYANLFDALHGNTELAVKPEEALLVIDVLQAALRSAREGVSVRFKESD